MNVIEQNAVRLETPFMIQQVESHLIFGPMSRHVPLGYVVLAGAILSVIAGFFATGKPASQYIVDILDKLLFFALPILMLRMTYRQQAILGWIAVKVSIGIGAGMLAIVGGGHGLHQGEADAWPNLFLGLIWVPGVEFIPRVTPHQRYVTLARIALSIPCIYFGVRSGNWHW